MKQPRAPSLQLYLHVHWWRPCLVTVLCVRKTPCLRRAFDVLRQSPGCPAHSRTHVLFRSLEAVALITCDTLRGVCASFHVVDDSEDYCRRQVSSCGRVCWLFIVDAREETPLLLPGSAHKLIWAFQGLKETGTVYANILDYNTHERVPFFGWNRASLCTTLGCQVFQYAM